MNIKLSILVQSQHSVSANHIVGSNERLRNIAAKIIFDNEDYRRSVVENYTDDVVNILLESRFSTSVAEILNQDFFFEVGIFSFLFRIIKIFKI